MDSTGPGPAELQFASSELNVFLTDVDDDDLGIGPTRIGGQPEPGVDAESFDPLEKAKALHREGKAEREESDGERRRAAPPELRRFLGIVSRSSTHGVPSLDLVPVIHSTANHSEFLKENGSFSHAPSLGMTDGGVDPPGAEKARGRSQLGCWQPGSVWFMLRACRAENLRMSFVRISRRRSQMNTRKLCLVIALFVLCTSCGLGLQQEAGRYADSIVAIQSKVIVSMLDLTGSFERGNAGEMKRKLEALKIVADAAVLEMESVGGFKDDTELWDAGVSLMEFYQDVSQNEIDQMVRLLSKKQLFEPDVVRIQKLAKDVERREAVVDKRIADAQAEFFERYDLRMEENELQKEIDKIDQ